jgi:hypothetical protein
VIEPGPSTTTIVILALQSMVFAALSFIMFRTLFRLRRRANEIKRPHSGIASEIIERQRADFATFREFATADAHRTDRRLIIGLVITMFSLIGLQIHLAPARELHRAPSSATPEMPRP